MPPANPPSLDASPLAALLHRRHQDITDLWIRRVLADPGVPAAKQLGELALRDAVPEMLDQLATALAATTAIAPTAVAGIPGVDASFIKTHAQTRIAGRYRMAEVILELSHLHHALAECCAAEGIDLAGIDARLVHAAIDAAVASAATEIDAAAHAELRLERERLRTVLSALPVGVCICDADGRITDTNAAAQAIWGMPSRPVEGPADYSLFQGWWPSTGHRVKAREWGLVRALLRGEVSRDEEIDILSFDGVRRTIVSSALPLRDAEGALVGAVTAQVDVTERTRILRALRSEAELRERFLAVLGHDLRTPLTSIMLASGSLLRRVDLPKDAARMLKHLLSSAQRMTRMINDLLDFTRARLGGGLSIHPQPADLTTICRQAIREIEASRGGPTVVLRARYKSRGVWDPDRLTQAVSNLIGNAVDYGDPDRPVEVRLCGDAAEVVLEVHNHGPPIPPDQLPTLFEPFRRGSTAQALASQGLGLGLFIACAIIRAHGGTIRVDSDAERGTTVTVRLPREPPPDQANPGPTSAG